MCQGGDFTAGDGTGEISLAVRNFLENERSACIATVCQGRFYCRAEPATTLAPLVVPEARCLFPLRVNQNQLIVK